MAPIAVTLRRGLIALGFLEQLVRAGPAIRHDASPGSMASNSMHLTVRHQVNKDLCKLWIYTYPWTECEGFADKYGLTMADFIDMNPSVAADCYGWVGGSKYCVLMPQARHISIDGRCGIGAKFTCIGSKFGDCCGKNGRCGSTDEFCAIGNCQAGICPGLGYSTNGTCGKDYGFLECGGSFGKCCSNAGVCGSTEFECGPGKCQSGACVGTMTSSASPPASTSFRPLPSLVSPSPDGTCGGDMKYKCTGTQFNYGNCCGARGYCGFSEWECSDTLGCQSEYGLCDVTVTVIGSVVKPSSTTSTVIPSTTSSTRSTTTSTTTTSKGNGIATPTPTHAGMASNCDQFYLVKTGDTCPGIGAKHGVKASKIIEWNTSLGSSCSGLTNNSYLCVRTVGYQLSTSFTCSTGTRTWGDNKPAALDSVVKWCNGDSSTDGSGGFATGQTKTGCYNTPFGANKIQFTARNDFGIGTYLSVEKCNELVSLAVNGCTTGGTGVQEGWWYKAVVGAGTC